MVIKENSQNDASMVSCSEKYHSVRSAEEVNLGSIEPLAPIAVQDTWRTTSSRAATEYSISTKFNACPGQRYDQKPYIPLLSLSIERSSNMIIPNHSIFFVSTFVLSRREYTLPLCKSYQIHLLRLMRGSSLRLLKKPRGASLSEFASISSVSDLCSYLTLALKYC